MKKILLLILVFIFSVFQANAQEEGGGSGDQADKITATFDIAEDGLVDGLVGVYRNQTNTVNATLNFQKGENNQNYVIMSFWIGSKGDSLKLPLKDATGALITYRTSTGLIGWTQVGTDTMYTFSAEIVLPIDKSFYSLVLQPDSIFVYATIAQSDDPTVEEIVEDKIYNTTFTGGSTGTPPITSTGTNCPSIIPSVSGVTANVTGLMSDGTYQITFSIISNPTIDISLLEGYHWQFWGTDNVRLTDGSDYTIINQVTLGTSITIAFNKSVNCRNIQGWVEVSYNCPSGIRNSYFANSDILTAVFDVAPSFSPSLSVQEKKVACDPTYTTVCLPAGYPCWQQLSTNCYTGYKSITAIKECGIFYLSTGPVYSSSADPNQTEESKITYTWTVSTGVTLLSNPIVPGSSKTQSNQQGIYVALNAITGNEYVTLNVTKNICGTIKQVGTYTLNLPFNLPKSAKPIIPSPTSFLTNQTVVFQAPNTTTGIKTWSFYYQNGAKIPSTLYSATIYTPESNFVHVTFSESIFSNNVTQLNLYAQYVTDYGGCYSVTSKNSNNFTLLSSNFTPPAPTNSGTYTGVCTGAPEAFHTNFTNNKSPITWKFYLDGVPLTTLSGNYTITPTGINTAKVTFNDAILAHSAEGDVAKITAAYDVSLALGLKKTSAPSADINLFSSAIPPAPRTVEISHLCTNLANFRLLGDITYKSVSFQFRYYYAGKYDPIVNADQKINFPAHQLEDGSWVLETSFFPYFAGQSLQYRVKVETACNSYYMYDWPVTAAQVTNQSFVLSNGYAPAYSITMLNGREQISSVTGQYLETGKCSNDVVTITADFPGSNPGDISSVDWSFDYRDNTGPVYSTSTNGNQLILNISNIPASTNNYLEVTANISTSDQVSCLTGGQAVQIYLINHSPDTIQVPVITSLPQKDKGKDSYCVGNNLYLYSTTIPGAIGYEWLTPDQKIYLTQDLKIPLTDHVAQSGDYKVRAFNESCAGNYATLNSTIQQPIAPSNPYYVGYQDITGRLGTPEKVISVTSPNPSLTDYHWYYGQISITNSYGQPIGCARPEDINQPASQFDGGNSIALPLNSYVLYGETYYYIDRCDYTVILKDDYTGCFSDPLVVYTDGVQSPQLRRGLADSTASNTTLIKLYPNPASNKLTVETGFESYKIQLINLYGSVILSREVTQSTAELDLSSVANGMYLVNIINGGNTTRKKIEVIR